MCVVVTNHVVDCLKDDIPATTLLALEQARYRPRLWV